MVVIDSIKSYYSMYMNSVSVCWMNTLLSKIKNVMGQEVYVSSDLIQNGTSIRKFMEKRIKGYSEKFFQTENNRIIPFIEVVMIDPGTFMIVATGRMVPGRQDVEPGDENDEEMYVYIFGRNTNRQIRKLKHAIIADKEREKMRHSSKIIYVVNKIGSDNSHEIVAMDFKERPLESLAYSNHEVETIRTHLDRFTADTEFYSSKHIPYKTGILLYGDPGTGKTSVIKAMASYLHRNICQINVASISDIDFSSLSLMIRKDDDKFIVVFEDIDTLYLNREQDSKDKDYNGIINRMLQFLDGNVSPEDVVFVATTNHIDRLDEALLREGRFDLKVQMQGLKRADAESYVRSCTGMENVDEVFELYGDLHEDGRYNQARLQDAVIKSKKIQQSNDTFL